MHLNYKEIYKYTSIEHLLLNLFVYFIGTSRASQLQNTSSNPPASYFTTKDKCNEPTMATTEFEPTLRRQKQLVLSNR